MANKTDKKRKAAPAQTDTVEIAEKVRSGEYFRESREMYNLSVHDPMAERYAYIFITTLSFVILLITLKAMQNFYPLNIEIPIIMESEKSYDDAPNIRSLVTSKDDNPDAVLIRFLVNHYVAIREEYDINTFDRNVNGVKNQSDEELVKEFQEFIDPRNPESPITLYQRHTKRKIKVLSVKPYMDGAEVIFEARLEVRTEVKRSYWRANMSFQYGKLELDEKTGKVTPLKFIVTKYQSKRIQDER